MPEKPEVVTVSQSLKKRILHKKITGCYVYWDNIIAYPTVNEFKKRIIDEVIQNITTRGKFIVIELDHYSLLVHLRMEGKFFFREIGESFSKHEHVELILDGNISFRYHDVRKFGKMYLFAKKDVYEVKPLSGLGLEYNDENLTVDYLYCKIHPRKKAIKTVLLDQSIIAGIGNIYANEILFMSRIHPERKASEITKEECKKIIKNCKIVLDKAIQLGGTTVRSFTSSEGVHGLFQIELLVHGKEGEECGYCNNKIKKIFVGGRGTYFCPYCQK